jgi:predicted Zn-dependent peptidase
MNTFNKKTFANGVRLITAPLPQAETATIIVMFATGSRYETQEINGMSHFLEHMFFKGTEKRPTSLDITKELDGVGAEFNAFTSKDHTAYYIKVAHRHLALASDVVADMLLNSKFDETELNKEKGVIVEEINMYEDNPLMYVSDIFEEEMYKEGKLGWLIAGSRETVRATTRQAMVDYKTTHYRGDNTVITVAGNLPANIESMVEEAFAPLE